MMLERKMKPRYYLIIAACCGLFLMKGCSYSFNIAVRGDNPFQPIFILTKPVLVFPLGKKKVPLKDFGVYVKKQDDWDYKNPIWRFGLQPGASKEIYKIQYGKVPNGFQEYKQTAKLTEGVQYLAMGMGAGCNGSVTFKIIKEDASYKLVVVQEE